MIISFRPMIWRRTQRLFVAALIGAALAAGATATARADYAEVAAAPLSPGDAPSPKTPSLSAAQSATPQAPSLRASHSDSDALIARRVGAIVFAPRRIYLAHRALLL